MNDLDADMLEGMHAETVDGLRWFRRTRDTGHLKRALRALEGADGKPELDDVLTLAALLESLDPVLRELTEGMCDLLERCARMRLLYGDPDGARDMLARMIRLWEVMGYEER